MVEEKLLKLGFSENLSKIYLALFHLGKTRAGEVIKETRLQRSVVYTGLEELVGRGLVTKTTSKGVAVYEATDVDALVYEAETKKVLAEAVAQELWETKESKGREVIVYEGDDIIKRIGDKSLGIKTGSTVYFLGPSKFGIQASLEHYWLTYHKKRIEKGIHCKILYDQHTDPKIVARRDNLPFCEARYLPFSAEEAPMSFIIYEDHVAIIVPVENPPLAFLIKSPATAQTLRKYFEFLWGQGKSPGLEK